MAISQEENEYCRRRYENRNQRLQNRLHECNPCCVFSLQTGTKVIAVANMLFWGVFMIFTLIPIIVLSLSYYAVTTNRVATSTAAEDVMQDQRDLISKIILGKKVSKSEEEAAAFGLGIGVSVSVIMFMLAVQAAFFSLAIMLYQAAEKRNYKKLSFWLIISGVLFVLTFILMIALLATEESAKDNVAAVFSVTLLYQGYCFFVVKSFHSQLIKNHYNRMHDEVIELGSNSL